MFRERPRNFYGAHPLAMVRGTRRRGSYARDGPLWSAAPAVAAPAWAWRTRPPGCTCASCRERDPPACRRCPGALTGAHSPRPFSARICAMRSSTSVAHSARHRAVQPSPVCCGVRGFQYKAPCLQEALGPPARRRDSPLAGIVVVDGTRQSLPYGVTSSRPDPV